jgi:hypothetical protein
MRAATARADEGTSPFPHAPFRRCQALFAEMIEEYFPHLPKIELNCRGKARPGLGRMGRRGTESITAGAGRRTRKSGCLAAGG